MINTQTKPTSPFPTTPVPGLSLVRVIDRIGDLAPHLSALPFAARHVPTLPDAYLAMFKPDAGVWVLRCSETDTQTLRLSDVLTTMGVRHLLMLGRQCTLLRRSDQGNVIVRPFTRKHERLPLLHVEIFHIFSANNVEARIAQRARTGLAA